MKCTSCGYVNLDKGYRIDKNGMYAICLECDERYKVCITTGKYRIECYEPMQSAYAVAFGVICDTKKELLKVYKKFCEEYKCNLCKIYNKQGYIAFCGLLTEDNYREIEKIE